MSSTTKTACEQAGLAGKIDQTLVSTLSRARWKGKAEPRLVWELFCSTDAITRWTSDLGVLKKHGVAVEYDAVFVHQKPYVQFGKKWKVGCELGDTLVVASDWTLARSGPPELASRSAILLQAKVDDWPPSAAHPQFRLFSKWPKFRFKSTSFRRKHPPPHRKFSGKAPHPRAQYLVVKRSPWALDIRMASLTNPSAASVGVTLVRLLSGDFPAKIAKSNDSSSHSDWSRTVWDLLWFVADTPAPAVQVGTKASRGAGSDVLAFVHRFVCPACSVHQRRMPLGGPPHNRSDGDAPTGPGFAIVRLDVFAPPAPA